MPGRQQNAFADQLRRIGSLVALYFEHAVFIIGGNIP